MNAIAYNQPTLEVLCDGHIRVGYKIRIETKEDVQDGMCATQIPDPSGSHFITVATINGYNETFTHDEQVRWAERIVRALNADPDNP